MSAGDLDEITADFRSMFESMRVERGPNEQWPPMVEFYRDGREIAMLIIPMDEDRQEFADALMRAAYGFTPDVITLAVDALYRTAKPDSDEEREGLMKTQRGDMAKARDGGDVSVHDAFIVHRLDREHAACVINPYRSYPHGIAWADEERAIMDESKDDKVKQEGLIIDIVRNAMAVTRKDGLSIVDSAMQAWKDAGLPVPPPDEGEDATPVEIARSHADMATLKWLTETQAVMAIKYLPDPKHAERVKRSIEDMPGLNAAWVSQEEFTVITDRSLQHLIDTTQEKGDE